MGEHILKWSLTEKMENKTSNHKTIVLDHSFGAKLMLRAVMGASMMKEESHPVDLLINLESAYSINRNSKKWMEETYDYQERKKYADHIALIWSEHDKAVTKAFYALFAGSRRAYKKVTKLRTRNNYKNIEVAKVENVGKINFLS